MCFFLRFLRFHNSCLDEVPQFHDFDPASEPSTRRRDGQVVLERRSEDGIQGQVEFRKRFFRKSSEIPESGFF